VKLRDFGGDEITMALSKLRMPVISVRVIRVHLRREDPEIVGNPWRNRSFGQLQSNRLVEMPFGAERAYADQGSDDDWQSTTIDSCERTLRHWVGIWALSDRWATCSSEKSHGVLCAISRHSTLPGFSAFVIGLDLYGIALA
jgi:hypothetical protein